MKSFKRIFLITLGILIGVAVVLFCLFNQSPVSIDFYLAQTGPLRLWFALLVSLFVGILLSGAFFVLLLIKYLARIRRLNREIQQLNSELAYFRNLPLDRSAYVATGAEEHIED